MDDLAIKKLCDRIRETSFAIHRFLRHDHLGKVYENALANRLRKSGLEVVQQHPLQVLDEDGAVIGSYFADLFVEKVLIVAVKAAESLADEHVPQVLGDLRATRLENGLLINFGAPKLQVRKYVLTQHD